MSRAKSSNRIHGQVALLSAAAVLAGTAMMGVKSPAAASAAPAAIALTDADSRGASFGPDYVNQAHEELMANPEVQRLLEQADLDQNKAAYSEALANLGKALGKEVAGELFRFGLGNVIDLVFDLFEKSESDPLYETLNEMMASLDSLHHLQQQTLDEVRALHDAIKLSTFESLNANVEGEFGRIMIQTRIASLLAEQDEVDPGIARGVGEALAGSVGQIATQVADTRGGGTIPALIDAFAENVTTGNEFWANLDAYRDNVRAMLAQAVVTATAVAENWDPAGIYAQAIADTTLETVTRMYGFGLQPNKLVANGQRTDYVQLRGGMALTARFTPGQANILGVNPSNAANQNNEAWELEVATSELLEAHLQKMAADYRPALHGGKTLEHHLRDNGMATRFAYDDTIRVVNYTTGTSQCTFFGSGDGGHRYHFSTVAVDFGTIVGNNYERQTIDYRNAGKNHQAVYNHHGLVERCKNLSTQWVYVRGSNDEARAKSAERVEFLRGVFQKRNVMTAPPNQHIGEHLVRSVDKKLGQGVVWVAANNSATGHLTDYDPGRIEEAAFG